MGLAMDPENFPHFSQPASGATILQNFNLQTRDEAPKPGIIEIHAGLSSARVILVAFPFGVVGRSGHTQKGPFMSTSPHCIFSSGRRCFARALAVGLVCLAPALAFGHGGGG